MNDFDVWLAQRIVYLHTEHLRLRDGVIGTHYLRCLGAQYHKFLFTGDQRDRFRTWSAARVTGRWRSFMKRAVRLGADPGMWVCCQLARMPGGTRENGARQVIHYFQPGVPV